jgi:putative resolvase
LSYTIGYCRVSSYEQKDDLERQKQVVELYCAQHGWQFEIIEDLGSGLNYGKRGLKRLIRLITESKVEKLVLTHKDRLFRP